MYKNIIVLMLFFYSYSFGDKYVDIYRLHGILAVEKEINKTLQDSNYWKKALSTNDLRFGYLSDIDYILLSQKSNYKLDVFKRNQSSYENIFNSKVLIGEGNGDKQVEGDLKTPVGIYELTRRNTNVDPFYGPLALVTSYPNLYDLILGKNGHGIWIHGVPEGQHREKYTQGCIAMENDALLLLDSIIDHTKSVLLISENEFIPTNLEEVASILASLYSWQNSWKENDINTYMSFYNKNFLRLKKGGVREDYSISRGTKKLYSIETRENKLFFQI